MESAVQRTHRTQFDTRDGVGFSGSVVIDGTSERREWNVANHSLRVPEVFARRAFSSNGESTFTDEKNFDSGVVLVERRNLEEQI